MTMLNLSEPSGAMREQRRRRVFTLLIIFHSACAGVNGQCTLQTPVWSGTEACAYATQLTGILQSGTIGTIPVSCVA